MKRKYYIILSLSYAIIIFILSSIPQPPSYVEETGFDKIQHIIEYSILGFFVLGSFANRNNVKIILLVIIICSIYGITDEIHQFFVPGRYFSILDMVANSVGVFIGILILRYYKKLGNILGNLRNENFPKFIA